MIESRKSAFSVPAGESVAGSDLYETLKEYFVKNNGKDELVKISKADKKDFVISDTDLATEFFGKKIDCFTIPESAEQMIDFREMINNEIEKH